MCGRFRLVVMDEEDAREMGVPFLPPNPRYNVAPTQPASVVRVAASGVREWANPRWGLVPPFAKDPSIGSRLINARSETVAERPAFRNALRRRRCLVPADGFYEWAASGPGPRSPHLIRRKDGRSFAFAGLWERWSPPGGDVLETFTLLTTAPNALIARLHDRMPVVLPASAFAAWLDPALQDPGVLGPLLVPAPDEDWEVVPVGPFVNRAGFDDPICSEPLAEGPPPPAGGQQTLL